MPTPSFSWSEIRFLNDHAEIDKTRRRLPHWQQDGKTFFVTFRLNDSLPVAVLNAWRNERKHWLADHPQPWSPETEAEYHRLFSAAIDRHLDQGHGSCLLRKPEHTTTVAASFHHFDGERYILHAFVVMPNHVHLAMSLEGDHGLSAVVRDWKRFTATTIRKADGTSGALWMPDHFDRLVRDWDHFIHICRYILRNPVKAKLPGGAFGLYTAPWVKRLLDMG